MSGRRLRSGDRALAPTRLFLRGLSVRRGHTTAYTPRAAVTGSLGRVGETGREAPGDVLAPALGTAGGGSGAPGTCPRASGAEELARGAPGRAPGARGERGGVPSLSACTSQRNFPLPPEVAEFNAFSPVTAECSWSRRVNDPKTCHEKVLFSQNLMKALQMTWHFSGEFISRDGGKEPYKDILAQALRMNVHNRDDFKFFFYL